MLITPVAAGLLKLKAVIALGKEAVAVKFTYIGTYHYCQYPV